MKSKILATLGGIAVCGLIGLGASAARSTGISSVSALSRAAAATPLTGDYVEARTCSVFAGACHYNSEYMTTGRDAILAFNLTGGSVNGVDLAGVKAMAVVSSSDNLAEADLPHHSEVVIDSAASNAQATALLAELHTKWGASLGKIDSVRRESVTFHHDGGHFSASAAGFGSMEIQAMPNDECCKMPNDVWYTPLMSLNGRKVGYTQSAAYTAATIGDRWDRAAENGAFYGALAE